MRCNALSILAFLPSIIFGASVEQKFYPAPVFDSGENLSYAPKCGINNSRSTSDPYPWRVAVGSASDWCYGILLSPDLIITSNCNKQAANFTKDIKQHKGYIGKCYDEILQQNSVKNCHVENNTLKILSIKEVHNRGLGTLLLWKIRNYDRFIRPMCLFNLASNDTAAKYYLIGHQWDVHVDSDAIAIVNSSKLVSATIRFPPREDFSFDYLVSIHSGRYFLRGIYDHSPADETFIFTDVLSLVREIVNTSNALCIMPHIPKVIYTKTDFSSNSGINSKQCGLKEEAMAFPWIARIEHDRTGRICSGVLISKRVIVTVAVYISLSVNASEYLVEVGFFNQTELNEERQQALKPFKILTHPLYNNKVGSDYNIGLLIFSDPGFNFNALVRPACLWDNGFADNDVQGMKGEVAGWDLGRNRNHRFMKIEQIDAHTYLECYYFNRQFYSRYLKPTYNFCAGGNMTIPCSGDGGSGFMVMRRNKWYLRGIVSFGASKYNEDYGRTCDFQYPSIYIDVAIHTEWIRKSITDNLL